ncbi:hypothetical protein JZ751_009386 [Albula glossodonta]|uniref:Uncharacterized protein n=1 Tax=Albula glossodonta TaxID=121402 RepID=A0A8T2N1F2_9TELE|nr:hypothetical protein JZ751_009386 [Albula glossodonta]
MLNFREECWQECSLHCPTEVNSHSVTTSHSLQCNETHLSRKGTELQHWKVAYACTWTPLTLPVSHNPRHRLPIQPRPEGVVQAGASGLAWKGPCEMSTMKPSRKLLFVLCPMLVLGFIYYSSGKLHLNVWGQKPVLTSEAELWVMWTLVEGLLTVRSMGEGLRGVSNVAHSGLLT